MAGRGVFGLRWDVVLFFAAVIGTEGRISVYFYIEDKDSKEGKGLSRKQ